MVEEDRDGGDWLRCEELLMVGDGVVDRLDVVQDSGHDAFPVVG